MKSQTFVPGVLLATLVLVACQAAPAFPSSLAPAPQPTAISAGSGTTTLTVLAAASLTDAFKATGTAFEQANPGVKVTFSFAGSQALRTQIEQGAKADVFASADNKNMDPVNAESLLNSNPETFTRNVLTVIIPKANPAGLKELKDLAKPGVKLVIADASVPVGNYTLQSLDKLSANPAYGSDFKTKVLANVVSKETDVKAVVSKVSLGEGDAGVVYTTDAQVAAGNLSTIPIPEQFNVIATYPIAVLKSSSDPALAQKFVEFVLGSDGQALLKKFGFAPLARGQ